jgi:hypothetical protein
MPTLHAMARIRRAFRKFAAVPRSGVYLPEDVDDLMTAVISVMPEINEHNGSSISVGGMVFTLYVSQASAYTSLRVSYWDTHWVFIRAYNRRTVMLRVGDRPVDHMVIGG